MSHVGGQQFFKGLNPGYGFPTASGIYVRIPLVERMHMRSEIEGNQLLSDPKAAFSRLLATSSEDQRSGLFVTGAGFARLEAGQSYPPDGLHPGRYRFSWDRGRILQDFLLLWISQGHGEFQLEESATVKLSAGSVVVLPPGRWHRYRPRAASPWGESWVSFNGEFSRRLLEAGGSPPRPQISHNTPASDIETVFDQLFNRLGDHQAVSTRLASADLFHLIALATDAGTPSVLTNSVDAGDRLVFDAVSLIWSADRPAISVDDLVNDMLVARRTLERAFRKQFGHGIHEEILRCRLERTKRLLADRSLAIEEVAVQSGFATVRSLRRALVAATGLSPQAYRNLLLSDPKAA